MSAGKNNQLDWQIVITKQPEKALRRIPRDLQRRIDRKIQELGQNPWPEDVKKLVGYDNLYRLRVGDWRISYAVKEDVLIVLILEIAPRGDAYQRF